MLKKQRAINNMNTEKIKDNLISSSFIPPLSTYNGIGFSLFGLFNIDEFKPLEFRMIWFCILYIPIFPLGIYLLEEADFASYHFYGRIKYKKFLEIFGIKNTILFLGTIILSSIGKILTAIIVITLIYYIFKFIPW
ncbi:MAG: hypothetical protein GF353_05530 [Candidatus Lokiarchaeota archaeon]|nr:hypothetical protein [Candidatus Lokiarchaeota archaeon]